MSLSTKYSVERFLGRYEQSFKGVLLVVVKIAIYLFQLSFLTKLDLKEETLYPIALAHFLRNLFCENRYRHYRVRMF